MLARLDATDAGSAKSPFLLALAGVPGAGKTQSAAYLKQLLEAELAESVIVLPMDGFHLYRSELDEFAEPERAHYFRGATWTFDPRLLHQKLQEIRAGKPQGFPAFLHSVGDPQADAFHFDPAKHRVVILEGIYAMLNSYDHQEKLPITSE